MRCPEEMVMGKLPDADPFVSRFTRLQCQEPGCNKPVSIAVDISAFRGRTKYWLERIYWCAEHGRKWHEGKRI